MTNFPSLSVVVICDASKSPTETEGSGEPDARSVTTPRIVCTGLLSCASAGVKKSTKMIIIGKVDSCGDAFTLFIVSFLLFMRYQK